MSKTYTIASKVHTDMRISQEVGEGEAAEIRSVVLKGAPHPDSAEEGRTENVDAELFDGWMKASKHHPAVANGLLRIVGDKEKDEGQSFGHEPGLDALVKDKDNQKLAAAGSTLTGPGPVKADDMAATSDQPNDDSPRSQTSLAGGAVGVASAGGPAPQVPTAAPQAAGAAKPAPGKPAPKK